MYNSAILSVSFIIICLQDEEQERELRDMDIKLFIKGQSMTPNEYWSSAETLLHSVWFCVECVIFVCA